MNKQLFTVFAVFCPCEWMMLDAEYCVFATRGGGGMILATSAYSDIMCKPFTRIPSCNVHFDTPK